MDDIEVIARKISCIQENIERIIRGKSVSVKLAVLTLVAEGHLLIEDIPGVGKTTLAQALASSLGCSFHRIQFTSDLLPSDIVGVSVYNPTLNQFEFKAGPIFTSILLADEINRSTPKTQSALLEAMNEGQVSVDKVTYKLPSPFMVIATQNPYERHGTFPLPESQLDRFMIRIRMGYPDEYYEREVLQDRWVEFPQDLIEPVITVEEVLDIQRVVENIHVDTSLLDYIIAIVNMTRNSDIIGLGISPRGAIFLKRAAQAYAIIEGRDYCTPDDIKFLAPFVFSHRIILKRPYGHADERDHENNQIIIDILDKVPVPV
ncbi:MAG: MoxR family ATPase [Thermodesulfobacteriota bacterium]|nr:MoxR family ATPase [Thermodesulfobacteriota bacterium]